MSIEKRVKEIIVEQLGVNESEVNPGAKFVDDLGANSLDLVELVMALGGGVQYGDFRRRCREDPNRRRCH